VHLRLSSTGLHVLGAALRAALSFAWAASCGGGGDPGDGGPTLSTQ